MTEYTMYRCQICGIDTPENMVHLCVNKLTEKRVREIADEQIAKARVVWKSKEELVREMDDQCRDDALEEALEAVLTDGIPSNVHDRIRLRIQALKSQPTEPTPAQDDAFIKALSSKPAPAVTFRGVEIPPHPQREEIIKPLPRSWTAVVSGNIDRIAALERERDALREQLPEGMKLCTITYQTCGRGHGWLSAKNWVQHGCEKCENDSLQRDLDALRDSMDHDTQIMRITDLERQVREAGEKLAVAEGALDFIRATIPQDGFTITLSQCEQALIKVDAELKRTGRLGSKEAK